MKGFKAKFHSSSHSESPLFLWKTTDSFYALYMQYVQSSNKEPNAFYSLAALFYLKGLSSVERKSGMTEGRVKDRAAFCITFRIKPKRSHSSSFAIFL